MPAATLAAVVVFLSLAAPAPAAWRPPVDGPVSRGFDLGSNPFEGGRHRGVDLLARPAAPVRATCAGRVVVAGRVGTSGGVVTVLCGRWRVSHMPLAAIAVREGRTIAAGTVVGTVARTHTHAGLHLGVRRDGDRFGYVDPLRFLAPIGTSPMPPLGRAPRGPSPRRPPDPAPAPRTVRPLRVPGVVQSPPAPLRLGALPRSQPTAGSTGGIAPWPAWAGLALVLAGTGVRWRGRKRTRAGRPAHAVVTLNR